MYHFDHFGGSIDPNDRSPTDGYINEPDSATLAVRLWRAMHNLVTVAYEYQNRWKV
jgi:hypothetical protein